MESTQKRFWERRTRTVFFVAVVLILVVLVNVLAARHPWRKDLTAAGQFTLAPQTVTVVKDLDQDLKITAFVAKDSPEGSQIKDLLDQYRYRSDKIKYELVDPEKEPALARQYQIQSYGTLVLESGGQQRRIDPYNLYDYGTNPYSPAFRGEQAVTRAILDLQHRSQMAIYFLAGHGELTLDGELAQLNTYLQGEGYKSQSLDLAQTGAVPGDARLVVLAGPRRDLLDRELSALDKYRLSGGKLVVLLDPLPPETATPHLANLLANLGVQAASDLVVDPKRGFFLDALSPMPVMAEHDITAKLIEQKLQIVLPRSRSLSSLANQQGLRVENLLTSSEEAWGETDLTAKEAKRDAQDLPGPLALALAVSKEQAPASAQPAPAPGENANQAPLAVVVGNAGFVTSQALGIQGNADFFMNAVSWLLGEENLLTIRPKAVEPPLVTFAARDVPLLFYGLVVVLPLAVLVVGLVVWLRRRAL